MDFDPQHLDVDIPPSQSASDIRDAYATIVPQAITTMGNLIADDPRYGSNESGHLAWDVSLLARAAVLAWRTTGRHEYLTVATDWARRLCAATDEARGAFDWRGRSGPIWSAGSRYTAGTATVARIRNADIRLQAAAHEVEIERPGATTAVIKTLRDGKQVWKSTVVSLLPEDKDYLPDVLASRSSVPSALMRGLPGPIPLIDLQPGVHKLRPLHASHLVHAGMISRSLLEVAEALISAGRERPPHCTTPSELLVAAENAMSFHAGELVHEGDHAWYVTPLDFPGRRLGLTLPYNHYADATSVHLYFARRHQDEDRLEIARALAKPFLDEIVMTKQNALPHFWHYYPVGSDSYHGVHRQTPMAERVVRGIPRAEDSSHATIRVRALADWKAIDPNFIPDETMRTVAKSFRENFLFRPEQHLTQRWLPGDNAHAPRRGHADSYAGAWGNLALWHPALKRQINSLARHNPPKTIFGATTLSATEILALNCARPAHPRQP